MKIEMLVQQFISKVESGEVEIYNEFSLQHELGIHLRAQLPEMRIQFERNVSYFGLEKNKFTKREIDIAIFPKSGHGEKFAIELKYPRNGQHPEQMFSFCKDIAFLEELRANGFSGALFLAVADDKLFYSGTRAGIYAYFRGGALLNGVIIKPTGRKDSAVNISGTYAVSWKPISDPMKYCFLQIQALT